MTALQDRAVASEQTSSTAKPTASRRRVKSRNTPHPVVTRRPNAGLRATGAVISLLALLIVGFAVYIFALSGVQEQRAQANLYKSFRGQLGKAIAPTAPTTRGAPVALLDIPAIGLRHVVVVEGTAGGNLTRGPGHLVATPLPGQAGVSTLFGRRATFGAPFAHLPQLRYGDVITVTTGIGVARYMVNAFGDRKHAIEDTTANRLVLITADSTSVPDHTITVSAQLQGNPLSAASSYPGVGPEQRAMKTDTGAVLPLMMWSAALALLALAGTFAVQVWSRWPAYLVIAPLLLAIVWSVYENAAQLLPNLY